MRLKNILGEESRFFAYTRFCAFLCVKDNIFMRNKNIEEEESWLFMFCAFYACYAFYAYKKHLSESYLFRFCTFYAFYAYKKRSK